jgi:hypothetical protein
MVMFSVTASLCLLLALSGRASHPAGMAIVQQQLHHQLQQHHQPFEPVAHGGWGSDTAGFTPSLAYGSLQSAWAEDYTQAQATECAALNARLLAHETRMLKHPNRQPLVYAPRFHGLGDRLKGTEGSLFAAFEGCSFVLATIFGVRLFFSFFLSFFLLLFFPLFCVCVNVSPPLLSIF